MQLGTRWQAGATPPPSVPEQLRVAIAAVEQAASARDPHEQNLSWTLTWLENRPVCRFDTGVTLRLDAHGTVLHTDEKGLHSEIQEDDWLV